jgi:uncharacterized membrane protein
MIDINIRLFRYTMWWKICYGALRLAFGVAMLRLVGQPLLDALAVIMSHELESGPNDILFSLMSRVLMHHDFYVTYFLAGHFIFWGIIDIVLSVNLLKDKLWAFPVTIYLIIGFMVYEVFRFSHTHSLVLLGVMLLDAFVLYVTIKEYRRVLALRVPAM